MLEKRLTKAEEEIMHILWKLEKAFVNEIIEKLPSPKPAYNTVSTIVRILEKKKFISHQAFGKTHQYYPKVNKKEYADKYLSHFINHYFSNSYESLVSFLTSREKLDLKEMEAIKALMENEIDKKSGSTIKKGSNHE